MADSKSSSAPRPRVSRRVLYGLLGLTVLCAVVSAVGLSAFAGARDGQRVAQIRHTATVAAALVERLQKGNDLLRAGQYELAQANFEYILLYQPENFGVRQLLATAIVAQTPTPTPTPTPVIVNRGELFTALQAAMASSAWDRAISLAEQLIAYDPTFRRAEVDAMLHQALVARGLARLRGSEIEAGLFDLERAEQIRPLSNAVEGERALAARYQSALYYFGADWERAIREFANLQSLAPNYRDVRRRLRDAYIGAGDAYSQAGRWCESVEKYAAALAMGESPEIAQRKAIAEQECVLGPSISSESSNGLSFTIPNLAGVVGKLYFSRFDPVTNQYLHFVYQAARNTATQVGQGPQPLVRPSFSPDRQRITYAAFQEGTWRVIVANTDGSAPSVLVNGNYPAWGPNGYIAFQGCSDLCGIHLIAPDNPSDVRRLTSFAGDINMQWSPDGNKLIYTSNYSGAWEIYTVSLNGEFQQLTGYGATSVAPTFSPDGSRIAFLSNRDGLWGIWIMNADGSNPVKQIDLGVEFPAWQSERLLWTN